MQGHDLSAVGLDSLVRREWLVVNGVGGYASSTVPGLNTRKYHGLLVAAMAAPVRRMVLLSRVEETVVQSGNTWPLASNEYPGVVHPRGFEFLRAFSRDPFPRWAYQGNGWTIEKTLRLLRGENTVCLSYALLGGHSPVELELRPLFALRPMHELTYQWNGRLTVEKRGRRHFHVAPTGRSPEVFFAHDGAATGQPVWYLNTIYRREQERGYAGLEDLWSPGLVKWTLYPGQTVNFVCSADPIDFDLALGRAERQHEQAAMDDLLASPAQPQVALRRSAAQFPVAVPDDVARARGSVITQFPWAAPSGRDALVAFAGLYLVPGNFAAGLDLLRNAAATLRGGLLPSGFTEDGAGPQYHGADVSLWFVNAVHDYLRYSRDAAGVARHLLEPVLAIVDAYANGAGDGSPGGVHVCADDDGLLRTAPATVPTTWMDARSVLGEVVTPRAGKPVELNALWHNALCVAAELCALSGGTGAAAALRDRAATTRAAFNARFWNADADCCFDVVDVADVVDANPDAAVGANASPGANDASVRPNQLFAISLAFPALAVDRHAAVLRTVQAELLTPYGVRTLAPGDADYRGRYAGDVTARDRAQHNGCAYPWLLGPFVTAGVRLAGRSDLSRAQAAKWLQPCLDFLNTDGLGHLPELFDGDAPHAPGGAVSCAASVAEILRAYAEDVQNACPAFARPEAADPVTVEATVAPAGRALAAKQPQSP